MGTRSLYSWIEPSFFELGAGPASTVLGWGSAGGCVTGRVFLEGNPSTVPPLSPGPFLLCADGLPVYTAIHDIGQPLVVFAHLSGLGASSRPKETKRDLLPSQCEHRPFTAVLNIWPVINCIVRSTVFIYLG